LAREGTYIRESKNGRRSVELLVEAFDKMLAHDKRIRLAMSPNPTNRWTTLTCRRSAMRSPSPN